MDDARSLGALHAVSIDMGHNIVSDDLFSFLRNLVVDVLSCSASARAIQSFLQVLNFISGEKMYFISLSAYLDESGDS